MEPDLTLAITVEPLGINTLRYESSEVTLWGIADQGDYHSICRTLDHGSITYQVVREGAI